MGNPRAFIVLVLTALVMVVGASYAEEVPLPSDLKIVPPDPSVPPELAKFSGKWGDGRWDGVLEHILVVEWVDRTGANVVYAYGTAPRWGIDQPGWFRSRGTFTEKQELRLDRNEVTVKYRLKGDKLEGTYQSSRGFSHITIRRIE